MANIERKACLLIADRNLKKLVRCSGNSVSLKRIIEMVGSKMCSKICIMYLLMLSPSWEVMATMERGFFFGS